MPWVTDRLQLSPLQPGVEELQVLTCPNCQGVVWFVLNLGELRQLHAQCRDCDHTLCLHQSECAMTHGPEKPLPIDLGPEMPF